MEFLRDFTLADESLHLVQVLLSHVLSISGILSFQEDSEKFQHRFLHRKRRIFESVLTHLSQSTSDDSSKRLRHECLAIVLLLKLVQEERLFRWGHLHWKLDLVVAGGVREEARRFLL